MSDDEFEQYCESHPKAKYVRFVDDIYDGLNGHTPTKLSKMIYYQDSDIINHTNSKKSVYFICGFGRSIEQVKDIVKTYSDTISISLLSSNNHIKWILIVNIVQILLCSFMNICNKLLYN